MHVVDLLLQRVPVHADAVKVGVVCAQIEAVFSQNLEAPPKKLDLLLESLGSQEFELAGSSGP